MKYFSSFNGDGAPQLIEMQSVKKIITPTQSSPPLLPPSLRITPPQSVSVKNTSSNLPISHKYFVHRSNDNDHHHRQFQNTKSKEINNYQSSSPTTFDSDNHSHRHHSPVPYYYLQHPYYYYYYNNNNNKSGARKKDVLDLSTMKNISNYPNGAGGRQYYPKKPHRQFISQFKVNYNNDNNLK